MIVTAHQPNLLPGLSVVRKVEAADAVVWLDEVQFSAGGWSNRNRMPDGSWLTVPVSHAGVCALNRVRISEHGGWRRRVARTLQQHYGPAAGALCDEVARPYGLLVGLNLALLRVVLDGCATAWHFQSHLDGGRALAVVSDDQDELRPISMRLARMTAELGGTTYLSGSSGYRYLDERPFRALGIDVEYFAWNDPNLCSACLLLDAGVPSVA